MPAIGQRGVAPCISWFFWYIAQQQGAIPLSFKILQGAAPQLSEGQSNPSLMGLSKQWGCTLPAGRRTSGRQGHPGAGTGRHHQKGARGVCYICLGALRAGCTALPHLAAWDAKDLTHLAASAGLAVEGAGLLLLHAAGLAVWGVGVSTRLAALADLPVGGASLLLLHSASAGLTVEGVGVPLHCSAPADSAVGGVNGERVLHSASAGLPVGGVGVLIHVSAPADLAVGVEDGRRGQRIH